MQANKFIELDGAKGAIQNTALSNQIDTIVHSLNKIMQILIIVSMLLTIIGILVGFVFGYALHRYILAIVPPDDLMFNTVPRAEAFVIPIIVIAFITLVLGLMMTLRLKNVDMLKELKSVE